ncbi:unnamed protein product [Durusdinium trenchii]|uniref:Uncharacterized protein n=1 Tax=Durusdinium trenchii TaxID=1381693 RepID=A0ABP0NRP1_9DINO
MVFDTVQLCWLCRRYTGCCGEACSNFEKPVDADSWGCSAWNPEVLDYLEEPATATNPELSRIADLVDKTPFEQTIPGGTDPTEYTCLCKGEAPLIDPTKMLLVDLWMSFCIECYLVEFACRQ